MGGSGLVGYGSESDEEQSTGQSSTDKDKSLDKADGNHRDICADQEFVGPEISDVRVPEPADEQDASFTTVTDPPGLDPSLSPYSAERAQLHSLTMPPVPSFSLPSPPAPSPPGSLAVIDKRIRGFLELKRKGVHFNERLENSSAIRDPGDVQRLASFAGIDGSYQYENTLPPHLGVDVERWTAARVEEVVRAMESKRLDHERGRKGKPRDFVKSSNGQALR